MAGLPWKLLYADYLVLIVNRSENMKKFSRWREGLEFRCSRVTISTTKMIISNADSVQVLRNGAWQCVICKRGVSGNSILRIVCGNWVHKRWSDVMGSLSNVTDFICSVYSGNQIMEPRVECIDDKNESLLCIGKFY